VTPDPHDAGETPPPLETTQELLVRVKDGDERALDRLVTVYTPLLRRWGRGRLPRGARDLSDTEDLVQVTLTRVLRRIDDFDPRHPGAFLAYLRRTFLNTMRNEIRRANRSPRGEPVSDELIDRGPSVLEEAIGRRALEGYERALDALTDDQRAAVILRVEFGLRHAEIAEHLGSPSANAARMLVSRGLVRLTELLAEDGVLDPPEEGA
jgi:RNA polymerase sigma-70 factor (ECF subfamily)